MSPAPQTSAPEYAQPIHHPTPVGEADVIEINPQDTAVVVTQRAEPAPWGETVVLGRSVSRNTSGARPVVASPIVDQRDLHNLMVSGRERYYSAPPPPRVQHRSWLLSSLVIAGGGVAGVLAAGGFGQVSAVATMALIATVLCGALLVAAQVAEEVRRARR